MDLLLIQTPWGVCLSFSFVFSMQTGGKYEFLTVVLASTLLTQVLKPNWFSWTAVVVPEVFVLIAVPDVFFWKVKLIAVRVSTLLKTRLFSIVIGLHQVTNSTSTRVLGLHQDLRLLQFPLMVASKRLHTLKKHLVNVFNFVHLPERHFILWFSCTEYQDSIQGFGTALCFKRTPLMVASKCFRILKKLLVNLFKFWDLPESWSLCTICYCFLHWWAYWLSIFLRL